MIYETRNGALCVPTNNDGSMTVVYGGLSLTGIPIKLGVRMQMLPAVPQRFEVIRENNLREYKV